MAKILHYSYAYWNSTGYDLGYQNALAYAEQLALQGHQIDFTCSLRAGHRHIDSSLVKAVPRDTEWSGYDVIMSKTIHKDLPLVFRQHYAKQVAKLGYLQQLFYQFDDIEQGWQLPKAGELVAWGFTQKQINKYLAKEASGIVSDHPEFYSMWDAFGQLKNEHPDKLSWYWNAQNLWPSLQETEQSSIFQDETLHKQWSIGYLGFAKAERTEMLRALLNNRPDEISFATFGHIDCDFAEFSAKQYFSREQSRDIIETLWTTLYLANAKVKGKLNTRLFESLDSSATLLIPKSANLNQTSLKPWTFETKEQLWDLIIKYSKSGSEHCQKGLAKAIAIEQWAKHSNLGLISL